MTQVQNQFTCARITNNMLRFATFIACFGILLGSATEANIQDHPYQVSISSYGSYECSGAIISAEWVLTTVHCLRSPREYLTVRAGTSKLTGGSVHTISKIVNHERYASQLARFNDVALVKVEPPFQLDGTRLPIPLVEAKVSITEGDRGVISGWGTPKKGEELPSLKAVETNIMSLSDCVDTYHSRFGDLQPGILCAKNERPGGAACSEIIAADDSGAPLVVDGRLAGVFSWGYRCLEPGFPSVFMEVAYFRDWIKDRSGI